MRGEGTSHEAHWWKLFGKFIIHFNEYHTQLFSALDIICADESISWWYGQGGHWINLGFPMYVIMDRNMENGSEIHNSECGRVEIVMWLRTVDSAKNKEEQKYDDDNIPNGIKVLKYLIIPWSNTDSIVCADSYFASVPAAE